MPNNEQAGNTIPIPLYPGNGWAYSHQASNTIGSQIKTGPGLLHSVVEGSPDTAVTLTLYDGVSTGGKVIGIIGGNASLVPFSALYDVAFAVGLFIVIAGGVAFDLTITYK